MIGLLVASPDTLPRIQPAWPVSLCGIGLVLPPDVSLVSAPEGAETKMEEQMALEFSICEVRWERYRRVSENPHAREWLEFQAARSLAANTIEAYGRDLDCYLGFLETENIPFHSVIRPTIGAYIRSITQLEVPRVSRKGMEARSTLANATLQQHLTVVRLFHDFLVEER